MFGRKEEKKYWGFAFLTALIAIVLVSCNKSDSYRVKVKVLNMTGSELKGLKIGDQRIGNLKNEEKTDFIPFRSFHFDSGQPIEPVRAKINNNVLTDYFFNDCGTSRYSVEEGTYEIVIRKWIHENKEHLRLELK
jgi:hypothetical protein